MVVDGLWMPQVMKFLNRQNRYAQLVRSSPAVAEKLQGELQAWLCIAITDSQVFLSRIEVFVDISETVHRYFQTSWPRPLQQ